MLLNSMTRSSLGSSTSSVTSPRKTATSSRPKVLNKSVSSSDPNVTSPIPSPKIKSWPTGQHSENSQSNNIISTQGIQNLCAHGSIIAELEEINLESPPPLELAEHYKSHIVIIREDGVRTTFERQPIPITCPHCQATGDTVVTTRSSVRTAAFLFPLWACCACLFPLLYGPCRDAVHTCQSCHVEIARNRLLESGRGHACLLDYV